MPAGSEEQALYKTFAATLDGYVQAQAEMLSLSQQNKVEEMRSLINTRIKDGTDLMGEQLNKLIAINSADAEQAGRDAEGSYQQAVTGIIIVAVVAALMTVLLATRRF